MDKLLFAALSFTEDENLRGRTYWYLSDFPLDGGERVLAPVGMHDRLQAARVVRLYEGYEADAPYDLALIKKVVSPYGARKLPCGDGFCLELGGVRYDDRHYTRYKRILVSDGVQDFEAARRYGVETFLEADENALFQAAHAKECVLIFGTGAEEIGARILSAVKGEEEVPLSLFLALRNKLC